MVDVVNPGSALGEAVGRLIEENISTAIASIAHRRKFRAESAVLRNKEGSRHQIDIVVFDPNGEPIVLVEPKYLRYIKHNWDKGSRLVVAHSRVRRRYSSIRKCIAILAGRWTARSKDFLTTSGIEIHEIPFTHIVSVFRKRGITFDWDEKDDITPSIAWDSFSQLSENERTKIGSELTQHIRGRVARSIERAIIGPVSIAGEVAEVEVSLRTREGELLIKTLPTVTESIKYLLEFQIDKAIGS